MSTASALVLTLALAANSDTVLLEFTAEWCGPCRVMAPAVDRLVSAGYPVRKIDIDRDARTASRFRVTSVPCFVMLVGGQEVNRVTGAVSHDRLVEMFQTAHRNNSQQRAGSQQRANPASGQRPSGEIVRAQSPDGLVPVSGNFGPRHLPPASNQRQAPNSQPQRAPLGAPVATNHRRSPGGVDPAAVRAAFQATVRLRVEDPQGHGYGTGTIIDAHGQEALVVTCGHLFRDSAGKGRIEVDLFETGQPRTVPGQLISYDLERDIALVSITPGGAVTPARVAASGQAIARGVPVFSIGCDKGQLPSVRESHVTAIDRYLGAPNIEVAGQPVDGRSGGGLFAADGQLIGICNAADPADDEGIYASLPTIHWELDRIGQRRIYEAAQPTQFARTAAPGNVATPGDQFAMAPAARQTTPGTPPTMPDRMVVPASARQAAAGGDVRSSDTDTEVICIIRSRQNPQGEQRLLVLDHPSADLLDRLRQESRTGAPARLAQQPRSGRRGNEPVIRAQSGDRY